MGAPFLDLPPFIGISFDFDFDFAIHSPPPPLSLLCCSTSVAKWGVGGA